MQLRAPPTMPVIATHDDLLAVALAANVVALYRSRLPRDPYALSKPLELQVRSTTEGRVVDALLLLHKLDRPSLTSQPCRSGCTIEQQEG